MLTFVIFTLFQDTHLCEYRVSRIDASLPDMDWPLIGIRVKYQYQGIGTHLRRRWHRHVRRDVALSLPRGRPSDRRRREASRRIASRRVGRGAEEEVPARFNPRNTEAGSNAGRRGRH